MTGPEPKLPSTFSSRIYGTLRPIWENALRFRRGQTRSGRKYSATEINAYIRAKLQQVIGGDVGAWLRQYASPQANQRSLMSLLTDVMVHAQNDADEQQALEPPTQATRNIEQLTTLTNAMGLNIPRMLSKDTRNVLDQYAARAPNEAMVGNVVGSLPTFALGAAAAGPKLGSQFLANAAMGGIAEAGNVLPNESTNPFAHPHPVRDIATQMGISGALGVLGAALPRVGAAKFSRTGPAADLGEQLLQRAGGEAGLERGAARLGTPDVPPTLAEISPEFGRATRQAAQMNPSAQQVMLADARSTLAQVSEAKQAISARYSALNKPLDNVVVRRIVERPEVQDVLRDLQRAHVGPPDVLDARTLNDVRMILRDEAMSLRRKGGAANNRTANLLSAASNDLKEQIVANVPEFSRIQEQIAPYIRRELRLQRAIRQLGGSVQESGAEATLLAGRGGRIPVGHAGIVEELKKSMGLLPYQRQYFAGQQLAPHLLTPAAPDVLATRLHGLWPWWTNPAGAGLLTGGYHNTRRQRRLLQSLLGNQD